MTGKKIPRELIEWIRKQILLKKASEMKELSSPRKLLQDAITSLCCQMCMYFLNVPIDSNIIKENPTNFSLSSQQPSFFLSTTRSSFRDNAIQPKTCFSHSSVALLQKNIITLFTQRFLSSHPVPLLSIPVLIGVISRCADGFTSETYSTVSPISSHSSISSHNANILPVAESKHIRAVFPSLHCISGEVINEWCLVGMSPSLNVAHFVSLCLSIILLFNSRNASHEKSSEELDAVIKANASNAFLFDYLPSPSLIDGPETGQSSFSTVASKDSALSKHPSSSASLRLMLKVLNGLHSTMSSTLVVVRHCAMVVGECVSRLMVSSSSSSAQASNSSQMLSAGALSDPDQLMLHFDYSENMSALFQISSSYLPSLHAVYQMSGGEESISSSSFSSSMQSQSFAQQNSSSQSVSPETNPFARVPLTSELPIHAIWLLHLYSDVPLPSQSDLTDVTAWIKFCIQFDCQLLKQFEFSGKKENDDASKETASSISTVNLMSHDAISSHASLHFPSSVQHHKNESDIVANENASSVSTFQKEDKCSELNKDGSSTKNKRNFMTMWTEDDDPDELFFGKRKRQKKSRVKKDATTKVSSFLVCSEADIVPFTKETAVLKREVFDPEIKQEEEILFLMNPQMKQKFKEATRKHCGHKHSTKANCVGHSSRTKSAFDESSGAIIDGENVEEVKKEENFECGSSDVSDSSSTENELDDLALPQESSSLLSAAAWPEGNSIFLADAVDALTASVSNTDARLLKITLQRLPQLIASSPPDLLENACVAARTVCGLVNLFSLDDFDLMRVDVLVRLIAEVGRPVIISLSEIFYGYGISTSSRVVIAESFAESALELSGNKTTRSVHQQSTAKEKEESQTNRHCNSIQKDSNRFKENSADNDAKAIHEKEKEHYEPELSEHKTIRWGSFRIKPCTILNRFSRLAACAFYSLLSSVEAQSPSLMTHSTQASVINEMLSPTEMHQISQPTNPATFTVRESLSLFGDESFLGSILLNTLATIILCTGPIPIFSKMCKDLLSFCWTLRSHKHPLMRKAIICCLRACFLSPLLNNDSTLILSTFENDIREASIFLQDICESETDPDCRVLATDFQQFLLGRLKASSFELPIDNIL
ncbi:putative telomere length regulation protein [Monocercomonoides exilis]|uniref:putative telomere length regulation protein n=1 Tax=Monocercomonoides exilis TaxID=2049356 RepID=UPI0035597598|nr:putative telomere length regulation protein [Monocercomonoides exilis]|eukprot:MONOS_337.1-p1 / transcript=MONOS_337.1 / gene=MONOS_337 / organism=Monocercomonoides_exilis_PA203 / gene_product=unspecified product / transcript_product=unspecified product / location=Mono_scaffold00005:256357-260265(-) / protein_length=1114 / sequence_SO=supercontig / SO=protein_coding / is_pseudo=false